MAAILIMNGVNNAKAERNPSDWSKESGTDFFELIAKNLNAEKIGIYKSVRGKGGITFARQQMALVDAKRSSPMSHDGIGMIDFQINRKEHHHV